MKLVITGGHLTPALALIDHALKLADEIVFVGRVGDSLTQIREKAEIENRQVTFIPLKAAKLHRHRPLVFLLSLPRLIISFFQAISILRQYQPDVVVSFGGYVSLPITLASAMLGIPVLIHEQTHFLGLGNQIASYFAKIITVSWPDTVSLLPPGKTVLTGNPIRPELFLTPAKPDFITSKKPLLYITGGHQGSAAINHTVFQMIPQLTQDYYCVHQTGSQADFDRASQLRQTLPPDNQANYTIRTWFDSHQVSWLLAHAALVISRSGANTITEIIYKQTPALLIPLPTSAGGEQFQNAHYLETADAGLILAQSALNKNSLDRAIRDGLRRAPFLRRNLAKLASQLVSNPQVLLYQQIKKLAHEFKQ